VNATAEVVFVTVKCPECDRRIADVQAPTVVRVRCPRGRCGKLVVVKVA